MTEYAPGTRVQISWIQTDFTPHPFDGKQATVAWCNGADNNCALSIDGMPGHYLVDHSKMTILS
jgi:hypothetical protein